MTLQQKRDNTWLRTIVGIGVVFVIGVLFVLFSHVWPLVFPESRWAYALAYDTDEKHVRIEPKPHDCDFLHAPLGDKHCHYEKAILVSRYGKDVRTGQPMVSYDGGKTWIVLPTDQKPGPIEVYVTWNRLKSHD